MPTTTITPAEIRVTATSATQQTALTEYLGAIAAAVTQAQHVTNVIPDLIAIVPLGMIFDGINYVFTGSVLYKTAVTV